MKIIVWLILCLIWGTTWIFIKIGLEDLPPITFAAARFILSLFLLFLIIKHSKNSVSENQKPMETFSINRSDAVFDKLQPRLLERTIYFFRSGGGFAGDDYGFRTGTCLDSSCRMKESQN